MSSLAVFGYASLVSSASASRTLGRPVEPAVLARLPGWRRRWSTVRDNQAAEKTFARVDSGRIPPFVLTLNLEPVAVEDARRADGDPPSHGAAPTAAPSVRDPAPNGVLIEVTEAELKRLDLREMRFRRVDVTGAVEPAGSAPPGAAGSGPPGPPSRGPRAVAPFDRVYAYTARPENLAPGTPPGAVVIAAYVRTVEEAFAALGPRELALYRQTTGPAPVEAVEAVLIRDAIPPGNPRAW